MSWWSTVRLVAWWEFRRFLKPKQLLLSVILTIVSGAAGFGAVRLFDRETTARDLPVLGGEALGLAEGDTLADPGSRSRFVVRTREVTASAAVRDSVLGRLLPGALVVHDADSTVLLARTRPSWLPALQRALAPRVQQRRLAGSGIDQGALARALSPARLTLDALAPAGERAGRGERLATVLMLAIAFIGLMSGLAYIFSGITGEKQLRVTEQVLSAISPQRWVDGKLFGLAGVALVNTLATTLALGIFVAAIAFATGRFPALPDVARPMLLLLIPAIVLLGFLLWFAFFVALAATIDDPNSSMRGSLLLLPMISIAVGGLVLGQPERALAQFFAIFPLTSWTVLPIRLLAVEVPWWEAPLAVLLLLLTLWLARRAAGKIFALGMLMYGKEPTFSEIRRWMRET